jgi:hypothetical protein
MSKAASRRVNSLLSQVVAASDAVDDTFEKYCRSGEAAALKLGNRGPLRFDAAGNVHRDIVNAYWRCGFYVLEGAIKSDELRELQTDFEELIERAPASPGSTTDRRGRPVAYPELHSFTPPLSDLLGGTNIAGGRHPMKMQEPAPPSDAPSKILHNIVAFPAFMESGLRLYGHPGLLKMAEALNGPDFTPFTETLFNKPAGLGPPTAWHQDPMPADWRPKKDPDTGSLDKGEWGFSFHASLYHCTAANGLWMLPHSNGFEGGRIDVAALAAEHGCGDMLPGAVPILCKPGDVYIQSRQALHGAFPNTSSDPRVTLQFGFHRRSSVLGVRSTGYGGKQKVRERVRDKQALGVLCIAKLV